MKFLSLSLALFASLAAAATGCSSAEKTGIADVTCPQGSTLTYANFGEAFMTDYCLECHTTRESPKLTTQAQIQAAKNKILDEAVYTKSMPEDQDITLAERQMLGEWLACGAP